MVKKKPEPRSWEIEYRGQARGFAYVTARDEDEAMAKFDSGDWDADENVEVTDVEPTSAPKENK